MAKVHTDQVRINLPNEFIDRIKTVAAKRFPGLSIPQVIGQLVVTGLITVEEELEILRSAKDSAARDASTKRSAG